MSEMVAEDITTTLKWAKSFNRIPTTAQVTTRLLCFHWAGGNGMVYRPWAMLFAPLGIDVLAMHCPGRLQRVKEPNVDSVSDITEHMFKSLKIQGFLDSDVPLVFFGHSLGAIIAFELAKRIQRAYPMNTSSLCHMILSSINTPTVLLSKYADPNSTTPKKHLMDDSEFIRDMTDLGGTEGVAEELIRMALPVIRADFKALETYRPQPWPEGLLFEDMPQEVTPEQRTRTPITVFGGYKDHFVCADACFDWFQFVLNGPVCLEAVIPIFRPETAVTAAENIVSALPAFRLFMDKEGTHFSVFDKESGSGAWAFGIITDTCQHYGSKRLTN